MDRKKKQKDSLIILTECVSLRNNENNKKNLYKVKL